MTKGWWRVVGAVVALGLVFLAARWVDTRAAGTDEGCRERRAADEKLVRTGREWTDRDLPGIGAYVEVHWQVRAAGDPCSRAPGPVDRRYQGIVAMRPEDARRLAAGYDWRPPATASAGSQWPTPDQLWPQLRPFVPAGVAWLHSERYTAALAQRGDLYLDPDRAVAFFVLADQ